MLEIWVPLLGGLALLVTGGELLVRGAVRVATRMGVSPLVIGLTLVGFGTSTPELVTSLQAGLSGAPGIAYGNIVGSNISNILLIIGVSAILFPITVRSSALKRDGSVMVVAAVLFAGLAAVMPLERWAGAALMTGLVGYIYLAFRQERVAEPDGHGAVYDKSVALQDVDPATIPEEKPTGTLAFALAVAVSGLALVVLGGHLLVTGAVTLARSFDISETVIGLTVVAIGTSMPELVTSVVAGIRRQSDVAFGNIVGSNIYNILGIGGMTAVVAPGAVPEDIIGFDNIVMVGVSLLMLACAYTRLQIGRTEGAVLIAGYVAYLLVIWP